MRRVARCQGYHEEGPPTETALLFGAGLRSRAKLMASGFKVGLWSGPLKPRVGVWPRQPFVAKPASPVGRWTSCHPPLFCRTRFKKSAHLSWH
jgi:hypothetical protein